MRNRILPGLLCLVLVLCLLPITAGAHPDYNAASPATYDSPHVHTPSQWRTTQPYHYKACTTCGEFLVQEDHYGGTATCAEEGTCAACGYAYLPKKESHTPSQWRTNQAYHYTVCTTCGEFLVQEDHYGGTATCAEPGVCVACGVAYLETTEDHIPDTSKWVARRDMYHFHKCKLCGAHCDIEDHRWSPKYHAVDASGHAYECADCHGYDKIKAHTPGPAATETTPQTCTVCGYIIAPAKGHEHELTRVPQTPADCILGGNIEYYFCVGCSDCFMDAEAKNKIPEDMSVEVGPLGHTPSDTWRVDGEYHWRTCTVCEVLLEETKMLHEDANSDKKCDTCACALGEDTIPETTGKPDTSEDQTPEKPQENRKNNFWLPVVLTALVCFGAAVTVAVIILKKKQGERS